MQSLRALAALSVVMFHVAFIGTGMFGVDIFFVISGFIISYVTQGDTRHFMWKRIFRIVPLYWTATLGVFVLALVFPRLVDSSRPDLADLARSLFFVPYLKGSGEIRPLLFVGWTLNYEMFFYALFAVALAITRRPGVFVAGVLALLVGLGGLAPQENVFFRFYTDPVVLDFAMGCLAYWAWRRFDRLEWIPIWMAVVIAAGAYALLASGLTATVWRPLGTGLPAALVFVSVLSLDRRVRFPAWLLLIGAASYSLYLLHPYFLLFVHRIVMPLDVLTLRTFALAAAGVFASIAFSVASFRYLEAPSNDWLKRRFLRPRLRPASVARPASSADAA